MPRLARSTYRRLTGWRLTGWRLTNWQAGLGRGRTAGPGRAARTALSHGNWPGRPPLGPRHVAPADLV